MPDLDLLDKTELWIVGVTLRDVRLPELAAVAAAARSLPRHAVFVTDVRDDHVVLDVLVPRVRMEDVIGRGPALLAAGGALCGVDLHDGAEVHSRGVLGILGTPADQIESVLAATTELETNLRAYIGRRVAVVSTGGEVEDGQVHDTNVEVITDVLESAGFEVTRGGTIVDDEQMIAARVLRLAEEGFGVVITTGGVGAEDKDRTIEGIQLLVPDLRTAVLAEYQVGHGRHVKPHVRVAAGRFGETTVIALPGPTREVRAALPALLDGLRSRRDARELAEIVAAPIRDLWRTTHDHTEPGDAGPR
ncbi:MAG: molybdopterin-binding protein [Aeromicrobium sp.]